MTAAHLPTPPVCTGSQPLSSTAETADMNPEATHRFLRGPPLINILAPRPKRMPFTALTLTAAIVPVAANAASFDRPVSSLFQHHGPFDSTSVGPSQSGLEGGGGQRFSSLL